MKGAAMKTVIIIDDEEFSRVHISRFVEKRGFKAITAANGKEGIKYYNDHRPEIVFLDIILPDIHGEDVFKAIKQINKEAKIYFITGSHDAFSRDYGMLLGANGYFTKPIMLDDIKKILEETKTEDRD